MKDYWLFVFKVGERVICQLNGYTTPSTTLYIDDSYIVIDIADGLFVRLKGFDDKWFAASRFKRPTVLQWLLDE
jgi:hypothetical protein